MKQTYNSQPPKPSEAQRPSPIKQIVDVMKKVDTKGPEAEKNEVSIKDKDGKRINLNDEDVRFDYFLGRFVRKSDKKAK